MDTRAIIQPIVDKCPLAVYPLSAVLRIKDRLQGGSMGHDIDSCIQVYCTAQQLADRRYIRHLHRDMWHSFILYNCMFREYFLFGFPRLSPAGRREFIADREKDYLCDRLSPPDVRALFWNKWKTYQQFRGYYRRDIIKIDQDTSPEDMAAFIKKHPRFVVKPIESCFGSGVHFEDISRSSKTAAQLLDELRTQNVILEEPIVQCQAMARFHPESVNTIRCTTFFKDGEPHILFSYFRMGQGGSIVDNAGSGGISAFIDLDTGVIASPAYSKEATLSFLLHPDTGEQIIGSRIPRWEELKALAKELSSSFPAQPYVGWDLALTDSGWVLVEANHAAQMGCIQITTRHGIRPLISQYFDGCRH